MSNSNLNKERTKQHNRFALAFLAAMCCLCEVQPQITVAQKPQFMQRENRMFEPRPSRLLSFGPVVASITSVDAGTGQLKLVSIYRNVPDVSLYDPGAYLGMKVFFENSLLHECDTSLFAGRYPNDAGTLFCRWNNQDFALIPDIPLFCNGHYCSDISLIVFNKSAKSVCRVQTGFSNETELFTMIRGRLATGKAFAIPQVDAEAEDKRTISWITPCNARFQ